MLQGCTRPGSFIRHAIHGRPQSHSQARLRSCARSHSRQRSRARTRGTREFLGSAGKGDAIAEEHEGERHESGQIEIRPGEKEEYRLVAIFRHRPKEEEGRLYGRSGHAESGRRVDAAALLRGTAYSCKIEKGSSPN